MTTSMPAAIPIVKLMEQYESGVTFGTNSLNIHVGESISNNGFFGSFERMFLYSKKEIIHNAPGCAAAPEIIMIANKIIGLGQDFSQAHIPPVRLFAPDKLILTTQHLRVGDLLILTEPTITSIACKKLTLIQHRDEAPESHEMIRSWLMYDDTAVETL